MTKKIEFTKEALKQIEKIVLQNSPKNTSESQFKVVDVQGLNIIFRLMKKLKMMILFLIIR